MNTYHITRCENDNPRWLAALLQLRAEFGDKDTPQPFVDFIQRRLGDETMLLLLAWMGDAPVGYALAFDVAEHPYMPEWTRAGYIAQFLVTQSHRRHGVGSLLMEEVNRWFDARGIAKVLLNVNVDNPTGRRFWEQNGFIPYATRMKRTLH